MRGKPLKLTAEMQNIILKRYANGENMKTICKDLDICFTNIYDFAKNHPDFQEKLEVARSRFGDSMICKAQDILDNAIRSDSNGNLDKGDVIWQSNRAKLFMQLASKFNKAYRNDVDVQVSNKDDKEFIVEVK